MVAAIENDAVALSWNPLSPVHAEVDGGGYWVFRPDYPARLTGSYADLIATAVEQGASLSDVSALAQEHGLAPFAAQVAVQRWIAEGYVLSGVGTPPMEASAGGSIAAVTHKWDRDTGRLTEVESLTGGARQDPEVPVVVVEDLIDVGSFHSLLSGPAHIVCLRGPSVVVASVRCLHCLSTRLGERRALDILAATLCGLPFVPLRSIASSDAESAADELLTPALAAPPSDRLLEWTPDVDAITEHQLVRVPGCPSCDPGGTSLMGVSAPATGTGPMVATDGYRSSTPEQTWDRYRHHVSELVGAVPWVEPLGRPELNIYSAGPNLARVGQNLAEARGGLRAAAGGKGTTPAAARAGALAEALERTSVMYRGDEPYIVAALNDLPNAVHPNTIQLFSPSQLEDVDRQWAAGYIAPAPDMFEQVPRSFDPTAPVEWSEYTVLGNNETRWLPASITWLFHPDSRGHGYLACSNGLAAGNTFEEAALQGLLETVERDSVAMWWYGRCHRPGIDLDSIDDERVRIARRALERPGYRTWVLDLTADSGVPTCVALLAANDGSGILLGCGAHLDPITAITRALTELAQIVGYWELTKNHAGQEQRWFDTATLDSEPWLAPTHFIPVSPTPQFDSVEAALNSLVERLHGMGLEVLVKDCTRSDIGLPVVRTFVPGFRHFWKRLGPGRLFDVPPRLGWRDGPYEESDLNRWAMFL
jgi:bacteriocin biosynthesis cyclodehydratase domain-containing protein